MDLVLASRSPRRRRLLATLGISFRCIAPEVEEVSDGFSPRDLVQENALRKWRWCCKRAPGALILAADTTVELDGYTLGKPSDRASAAAMLRRESGREQAVHTGYVLAYADADGTEIGRGVETSWVEFKTLTEADIAGYLDMVQPYDRAGAYDIDESGDLLVKCCRGSRTNVMGLPLERMEALFACWI